jgi:hypothetical protein
MDRPVGEPIPPVPVAIVQRIERIEAHLAIEQLAVRYAMAVDARDIDAWVGCFRPDMDVGRSGRGRDALRSYIEPLVRGFYRSVHQICGHRIELKDPGRATGAVYCRAEHEVGDEWIVMAICYFDDYACIDGDWFFSRRRERHWYAADVAGTPQSVGFAGWPTSGDPGLPAEFPSWTRFWDGDVDIERLTSMPTWAVPPRDTTK